MNFFVFLDWIKLFEEKYNEWKVPPKHRTENPVRTVFINSGCMDIRRGN